MRRALVLFLMCVVVLCIMHADSMESGAERLLSYYDSEVAVYQSVLNKLFDIYGYLVVLDPHMNTLYREQLVSKSTEEYYSEMEKEIVSIVEMEGVEILDKNSALAQAEEWLQKLSTNANNNRDATDLPPIVLDPIAEADDIGKQPGS